MASKSLKISLIQCDNSLGANPVASSGKGSMPPLGLLYLTSYLKKFGYDNITILDLSLNKSPKKLLTRYFKSFDGKENHLVGFNMGTQMRFVIREAIEIVAAILPDAIICAGGPHPTLDKEGTLEHCKGLDFVVIGEGEETFLHAVTALGGNFSVRALKGIDGISYKDGDEIIHNQVRARIRDLDTIPMADRDLVDVHKYRINYYVKDKALQHSLFSTSIIATRGCPYKCIFCSVADQWQRTSTFASPGKIVAEMKTLKYRYGFNSIYFCDDTFNLNKKWVREVCSGMIDEKLHMTWFCEVRANTMDADLLALMYKAGLRSIAMAVESGHPKLLKEVVKKGITLEQATDVIENCRKIGVYTKVFFTYSYPTETLDDFKVSLEYAKKVRPDNPVFSRLMLYPGTPLFDYAGKHGLLPEGFHWFKYYPLYNSLSNRTSTVPVFRDRLTDKDFIWITRELDRLYAENKYQKTALASLAREFMRAVTKLKTLEDYVILRNKLTLHLKHMV